MYHLNQARLIHVGLSIIQKQQGAMTDRLVFFLLHLRLNFATWIIGPHAISHVFFAHLISCALSVERGPGAIKAPE